jgi:hypothetical protein
MGLIHDMIEGFFEGFVEGSSSALRMHQSRLGTERVERLCNESGWHINERSGNSIVLYFEDSIVRTRRVRVGAGDRYVGFICGSAAAMPSRKVPYEVLGYLLSRNSQLPAGAWQVAAIDGGKVSFYMTCDVLLKGLDADEFQLICASMAREVHDFDAKMKEAGIL